MTGVVDTAEVILPVGFPVTATRPIPDEDEDIDEDDGVEVMIAVVKVRAPGELSPDATEVTTAAALPAPAATVAATLNVPAEAILVGDGATEYVVVQVVAAEVTDAVSEAYFTEGVLTPR